MGSFWINFQDSFSLREWHRLHEGLRDVQELGTHGELVFITVGSSSCWNGGKKDPNICIWWAVHLMNGSGEQTCQCGFWMEVSVARIPEWMQIVDINGHEKGFCFPLMYIIHIKYLKERKVLVFLQESHRSEVGVKRRNRYTKPYQHRVCIIQRGMFSNWQGLNIMSIGNWIVFPLMEMCQTCSNVYQTSDSEWRSARARA